jgi:hypothetical protein
MRSRSCVLALILVAAASAADHGASVDYVGGTLPSPPSRSGVIDLTDDQNLQFKTKKADLRIPYERINLIEYGQQVGRRYAMAIVISPMLLLSKSRKHFVTLGYTDDAGRQQAMVLRVGKGHIRALLVSLETKTGRKVQYQDAEARKAGKG